MRTRDYKADIEKISEGYQEARDEEFNDQFRDFLCDEEYVMKSNTIITEDDVQGFLESFTFPEEFEWSASEYESQIDAYEDAKFESFKDERLGLNE